MIERLTHIQIGEMVPYYIMRYGFYEGHTDWRGDPVSTAFVFGLKDLQDLHKAFAGKLDEVLATHFTRDALSGASSDEGLRNPES